MAVQAMRKVSSRKALASRRACASSMWRWGFFRLRRPALGAVREVLQEFIDRLVAGAAVEQGMTGGWPGLGAWFEG